MIQLILCGLVTGLLYFWNYKYCKLSADPAYALQNPIMLRISSIARSVGTPAVLAFLFYTYKGGKGKGFMHFMGIIAWIPWVCLNGMLLYLIMK